MQRFFPLLLRYSSLVLVCTCLLIAGGLWAWNALPIDAYPDVTSIQVTILTKAHGLSVTDVEQQISFPIEQKMSGMKGVQQVRSLSKSGLSQITIVFADHTDPYFARQMVFERLQETKEELPPEIEPELAPLSTGLGEIFQYTLESEKHSDMELRTLQDWVVAPRLRPIAGVSEVNSFGGTVKQYHVLVDPERLQKFSLTLDEVTEAVEKNNANASGKYLARDWEQVNVTSIGLFRTPEDIGKVVLKTRDGIPIRIADVAEIAVGHEVRQGAVTRDGKGEAVAGMVIMLRDSNSKTVVDAVKNVVPDIQKSLPEGVRMNVFYDRTYLIEACIKTVMDATNEGGICVILVLFLFLAELRTAMLVVLSLPLTFFFTFLVMHHFSITSNLMSLGGLAFSVGMVVDATVVVLENARRHLAHPAPGESTRELIARSVGEVARPVSFAVLIVVLVLVPLFALEGLEAKMFEPLALTMLISLLTSLVVALFIMPALGYYGLPHGEEHEFFVARAIHAAYRKSLELVLAAPRITVFAALLALIGTGFLVPLIGTDFMPALQEGALAINAVRLPNASLEGAVKVSTEIEKRLLKLPEVAAVVCKTGRAEISEDPMGPEQSDIFITFRRPAAGEKLRTQDEMTEVIRAELEQIVGLRYSFSQPIALRVNELISGIKSDVAIKIFGDDLEVLKTFAQRATGIAATVDGARDVKSTQISGMSQIEIEIDHDAASRYGLNVGQINTIIETGVGGKVVSKLIEGQQRFAIAVRFGEKWRDNEEAIGQLKVPAGNGSWVPLDQICRIRQVETPIEITRENGHRRMVVETNVRGRDLGGFVADLRAKMAPLEKELPPGYYIEYGGQFENQQRAMARLEVVVPAAIVLIFILLVLAMGYVRDALLVILNLPFALVGGIVAVIGFGMSLSVSAAVAFIVLLGIAVQNGVLLVAFFRQLLHEGCSINRAVRRGCAIRFRPLVMTALTSFIGHLPMLFATGSGAEIQKPLAVVVMGGLVTSTILTLLILPVLFRWTESRWLLHRRARHQARLRSA
ncbi:MAG TPA: CusA/CzcA family heavy metal efflux RND transporter [Candidatus Ozemobacteraceae bacterium]|nr:CusA/CzcA family heavy metal efflux RND transporter [Candidatus Ozemobacteraceae bacterium]